MNIGHIIKLLVIVLISLYVFSATGIYAIESPVLLFDNFDDGDYNGWNVRIGGWTVINGVLVGSQTGNKKPGRIEAGSNDWDNYRLELDINNIWGVDEGIGFRKSDVTNTSYELTLRHGTGIHGTPEIVFYKVKWNGITQTSVTRIADTRQIPLVNNKWYHIRIDLINSNITVWVDNTKVFDINDSDPNYKEGYISLATWTGDINNIIVNFDNVRVTRIEGGITPFLELPFDYFGKNFEDVALNPSSWFDHQYPTQDYPCCDSPVTLYTGEKSDILAYRSHSGYDYASRSGVKLNTPVLAAAGGQATFKSKANSGGAGNVIKINHGNGYQTWYEHLDDNNLVISQETGYVPVVKGQQVGKVGMTGNTNGPHIHFSVFKDSNNLNGFSDEIPFGVTDPLGWEGSSSDPWPLWSSNGRFGSESSKLFIAQKPPQTEDMPIIGGTLTNDHVAVTVPSNASSQPFKLLFDFGPFSSSSQAIRSIVPSISLNAVNSAGTLLKNFNQDITITFNYTPTSLFNINEDSLKIYTFDENTKAWEDMLTTINKSLKQASVQTNHLSRFALMGTLVDTTPPTTNITLVGEKGQDNWYRSDVEINFDAQDEGLGVDYTFYKIDGGDWEAFDHQSPPVIKEEGNHQVDYYSIDKDDNTEEIKSIGFNIDKTFPEISLSVDKQILWPANGKMIDIFIDGDAKDNNLFENRLTVEDEYGLIEPLIEDFGHTIKLEAKREGVDLNGRTYTIRAISKDKAGNMSTKEEEIVVPHDLGDQIGLNIKYWLLSIFKIN